jgi:hypothetical protein
MNHTQIKQCAEELGYEFDDESCQLLLAESPIGETVWHGVTDYLNAYESCKDFDQPKYRRTRNKWSKAK